MFVYEVDYRTEKSRDSKHKVNEDYFMHTQFRILNDETIDVLVLADGMGGLENGEKASYNAVHTFLSVFYQELLIKYQPNVKNFSITHYTQYLKEAITEGIVQANRAVCAIGSDTGTTLSTAVILGNYAVIANIGDSPVYYYAQDEQELFLVSELQTQAQKNVLLGEYQEGSEEYYQDSNILMNYLGMYSKLPVENIAFYIIEKLSVGDMLFLASDGAVGRLDCETLQDLLCRIDGALVLKEIFKIARQDKNDDQTAILYKICQEA